MSKVQNKKAQVKPAVAKAPRVPESFKKKQARDSELAKTAAAAAETAKKEAVAFEQEILKRGEAHIAEYEKVRYFKRFILLVPFENLLNFFYSLLPMPFKIDVLLRPRTKSSLLPKKRLSLLFVCEVLLVCLPRLRRSFSFCVCANYTMVSLFVLMLLLTKCFAS
jgi:hypothetical protein